MARDFDGTDQLVTGSIGILNGVAACSMSAWVRRDTGLTDWSGILQYRDGTSFEATLGARSTHLVRVNIWTATDGFGFTQSDSTLSLNTWHHLGMTYDGSNLRLYFDGVDENPLAHTGNLRSNNRPVYVGRNPDDAVTFLGRIDKAVIWAGVALTPDEMAALAEGVPARRMRPLSIVGDWPLWGMHSPEIDLSGNGNKLTITGAVVATGAPVSLWTPKWAATVPLIEVAAAGDVRRHIIPAYVGIN